MLVWLGVMRERLMGEFEGIFLFEVSDKGTHVACGNYRIEETFIPWLKRTMDAMLPYLPPPSPSLTYGPTALPPPLYELSPASLSNGFQSLNPNGDAVSMLANHTSHLNIGDHRKKYRQHTLEEGMTPVTLRKNKRVTPEEWWQDVREIELELEDHTK